MEFTLLWAVLTGFGLMWVVLRLTGQGHEFDRLLGATIWGLAAGRLTAMALAGVNPLTHPADILVVRGGVNPIGATVGALAALIWSARGDRSVLDAITPAAVAAMAGWHGGCLWRDACLGAATDVPWGWALEGSAVGRHPVELYAALLLLGAAWLLTKVRVGAGVRFCLGLAAVAGARLITQPLRPSLSGSALWWYAFGLIVAVSMALVARRRTTGSVSTR